MYGWAVDRGSYFPTDELSRDQLAAAVPVRDGPTRDPRRRYAVEHALHSEHAGRRRERLCDFRRSTGLAQSVGLRSVRSPEAHVKCDEPACNRRIEAPQRRKSISGEASQDDHCDQIRNAEDHNLPVARA